MPTEGILPQRDVVMIGAPGGREAGVYVIGYALHALHINVGRQHTPQTVGGLGGINGMRHIEMSHHLRRMDSSIRSACSYAGHFGSKQPLQCLIEESLHGDGSGLHLPAVIATTIKGEGDEISHGGGKRKCEERGE